MPVLFFPLSSDGGGPAFCNTLCGEPCGQAKAACRLDLTKMPLPGKLLCALLLACGLCAPAFADVMYQCVDADGRKSFSNIKSSAPGLRCTAMDLGPAGSAGAGAGKPAAAKTPTPAGFPKVDENSQRARDNDRRRILEGELAAEQKALEEAKKLLAEQEALILPEERMAPQTHCVPTPKGKSCTASGGGIAGGKVEERLQPFRDRVALHQRNIEAIQQEIYRLR